MRGKPITWMQRHRFLLLNGLFWLIIGLETYATATSWSVLPINEKTSFYLTVLWPLPGFLFCAWLHRRFSRHPGWQQLRGWRRAAVAIASLVLFVAAFTFLLSYVLPALDVYTPGNYSSAQTAAKNWLYIGGLQLRLLIWVGFYMLVLGALDLRRSERQRHQQEQALIQGQLRFLTSAFQPHFLMNGLNAIVACRHDPEEVRSAAVALADYLRYAIAKPEALEPLQQQLDALENYISVQELRFGERFCCDFTVDKETLRLQVPSFLLQPLVENACKHGAIGSDGVLRLAVHCRRQHDQLIVSVQSSGRWQGPREGGYGLEAVRQQLELYYSEAASLRISNDDGNGNGNGDGSTTVTLALPIKEQALAHA